MWDRIVVEKMEECVGDLVVDVSFKNTKEGFLLAFASMVQTQIMRESLCGMSWQDFVVYGAFRGPFEVSKSHSIGDELAGLSCHSISK